MVVECRARAQRRALAPGGNDERHHGLPLRPPINDDDDDSLPLPRLPTPVASPGSAYAVRHSALLGR